MVYDKQRQRSNESVKQRKVTFFEGLKLWANQWRWSNIKAIWNEEYSRVYGGSMTRLNTIKNKMEK